MLSRQDKASTCPDAIERLNQATIDLILGDVMIPGVDGFEVCHRVEAHLK